MLEAERIFECSKCKYCFSVKAEIEQFYSIPKPLFCPSESDPPCKGNKFILHSMEMEKSSEHCKDYQEIKIQEQINKLGVGNIPRSISVVLEDDLVDTCKAGDDVTITGIVMRRWKPPIPNERSEIELFLKGNHIQVHNEQRSRINVTDELKIEFEEFWEKYKDNPMQGRNQIISNICSQTFGMYIVKLAVALALIGGVRRVDPSGKFL